MSERPDLSAAVVVLRHRDPALDEAWGEGEELTLHLLPDGRVYQERSYRHIDHGDSSDDRLLGRAEAIAVLAGHGQSAAAARLFPDSVEARWFARFGACQRRALDPDRVRATAERVWSGEGVSVHAAGDDLWVLERPGWDPAVVEGETALLALLEVRCPAPTLTRWWPDASPVRLLLRLGAASWPAAAPALFELARRAAPSHAWSEHDRERRLAWLDEDGLLLLEERRAGATRYQALSPLDAAPLLNAAPRARGLDDLVARVFPGPGGLAAALVECQRRAGISFPG